MKTVKLVCTAAVLMTSIIANAQVPESGKNEYSVYLTGGLTNLVYGLKSEGKKSVGCGMGGGFAYTYNFFEELGVSVGVEFQNFSSQAAYKTINETYNTVDNLNQALVYEYSIRGYEEFQNVIMFAVPIKAQYKIQIGRIMYYYAAGGFKLGFPVIAASNITAESVTSSGYYEAEMITYTDLPQHGFFHGHKPNEQNSKIDAGFALILSLESGIRFNLGKTTALYTGLYLDYAPNNMKQTKNKHLLNFNREITYESVLGTDLADKLNLIGVGLKVRFSLF